MNELPPSYAAVEGDPAAYAPAKAVLDAEFRIYLCEGCGKQFRWPAGKFKAAQAQHELVCEGPTDPVVPPPPAINAMLDDHFEGHISAEDLQG